MERYNLRLCLSILVWLNICSLFFSSHKEKDFFTFANYLEVETINLSLELEFSFELKSICGIARLDMKVISYELSQVILDTYKLEIDNIEDVNGNRLKFTQIGFDYNLGTPLVIPLPNKLPRGSVYTFVIQYCSYYNSEYQNSAMWLNPEQTYGKKNPLLFTVSFPNLSRTIFPCQDTPAIKTPVYTIARVAKPFTVTFSGLLERIEEKTDFKIFYFRQPNPIQSYLVAYAVGILSYRKLAGRCGVWAEPELIEKAAYEFEDTESFLRMAENYLHPYRWTYYDVLVLPPSFPFSGMENPNLTFLTPSLITGDKSLVYVVAHELSHSWFGNTVTNENWENFWINEGFTTFMERKLYGLIFNEDTKNLESIISLNSLKEAITRYPAHSTLTSLHPNLFDLNPIDNLSKIPYDKGFVFLDYLEHLVGEANFQLILREYLSKHAFTSISYLDFQEVFENNVEKLFSDSKTRNEIYSAVDWSLWIYQTDTPGKAIEKTSKYIQIVQDKIDDFKEGSGLTPEFKLEFKEWPSPVQSFLMISMYQESTINEQVYIFFSTVLGMNKGYNDRVSAGWYKIGLKFKKAAIIPFVEDFVSRVGIYGYLYDLYFLYYQWNKDNSHQLYLKNKAFYHSLTRSKIERIFNNAEINDNE